MIIGIGADHNAYGMKEALTAYIKELGHEVVDFGSDDAHTEVDYPEIAFNVAEAINEKKIERGILVCGTGIGMAIAACKIPGIRAALCHDTFSAARAQLSNNAQIISMGERIIGMEVAKQVVKVYLESFFAGGNSARKVQQIIDKEQSLLG